MSAGGWDRQRTIAWAANLGAVSAEGLAIACGGSAASARGRLNGAVKAGLMRSWRLLQGRPTLYTVTRSGLRCAAIGPIAPGTVSAASAAHALACCEAAALLERAFPAQRLLGEPALRREPRRWAVPLPGCSGEATHRPDLVLVGDGRPVAIEVELSVKSPRRLQAICTAWARSRSVSGAIYLASPPAHAAVARAIASTGSQERIALLTLDSLRPAPGSQRTVAGAA